MPTPLEITCSVSEDGKLPKTRKKQIGGYLKLFAGGEVTIKISRPTRTTRANRYYWAGVIEPIRLAMMEAGLGSMTAPDGTEIGITAEAVHEHFKWKYLPVRTAFVFGEDKVLPPTTTDLDQTAFSDYIEAIKNDEEVLMLGVYFEDPDPAMRSYSIAEP